MSQAITKGPVHKMPTDLRRAISANPKALAAWNDITPLARNEWVCWTITVKQQKTRDQHVKRAVEDLKSGKRRPCCWAGCPHRNPNAAKYFQKQVK